ncbi:hypothetical protein SAMN05660489_05820 [Pseudomonas sp. LAMO17WK12:I10]|nr:hypothetical protein H160_05814 [Pseudomonas sp. LAMO17WK12:I9]SNY51902.1 hypothetical protein SAMN05660489_05820 [Pseudomonas sp. LAMO17WK12:I10]
MLSMSKSYRIQIHSLFIVLLQLINSRKTHPILRIVKIINTQKVEKFLRIVQASLLIKLMSKGI